MGDDEPPKLALVPPADPAEVERELALRELGWDTREMAANLLRITRGAGRPQDLPQQIINLSEAILRIHKNVRAWAIWSAIEETLQSWQRDWEDIGDREMHENTIVRGSLQMVASKLVRQSAQEAAGRREVDDGIERRERYFEKQRQKWAEEEAAARAARLEATRLRRNAARDRKERSTKAAATKAAAQTKPAPPSPPADLTASDADRPSSTAEFMKARQREIHSED